MINYFSIIKYDEREGYQKSKKHHITNKYHLKKFINLNKKKIKNTINRSGK
jgi:hypothetical protein